MTNENYRSAQSAHDSRNQLRHDHRQRRIVVYSVVFIAAIVAFWFGLGLAFRGQF